MKKLMFATALAASVAAFADPINAISFEDYAAGTTFGNGAAESNDVYNVQSDKYFYFDGDSNSSVVTNESPAVGKHAAYFSNDATNDKYLALDTEGGTFWRGLKNISQVTENEVTTYDLGESQAIAATGTYLDTLVQFTVTEDDEPTIGENDKLAIWLGVETNNLGEVTGTNLMVKAAVAGGGVRIPTTFKLNATVEPGVWYRLTVKAFADITDEDHVPGFQIFLDGNVLASSTITVTSSFLADLEDYEDTHYADIAAGKYFASLKTATTIQGVGFQGTGAVDEIVWTEDDLFPAGPSPIEFTLTWGEGVSTVQYVLSTDMATTNSLTSGTAVSLAPGDGTATIELIPEFASGYVFDKVTMGETELGLTFEIPSVSTNATLFAKVDAPAYPTYITDTTDTYITGKYNDWKAGVGCDDATASTYEKQFLLNVDEAITVGETALEITEIKQNATAGWDITVGCSISGVGLTGETGTAHVCNGYLAVSYTDDLTGTWTTENINITAVDATTGTVTVNVNKSGAKFMKVSLKATQETVTP